MFGFRVCFKCKLQNYPPNGWNFKGKHVVLPWKEKWCSSPLQTATRNADLARDTQIAAAPPKRSATTQAIAASTKTPRRAAIAAATTVIHNIEPYYNWEILILYSTKSIRYNSFSLFWSHGLLQDLYFALYYTYKHNNWNFSVLYHNLYLHKNSPLNLIKIVNFKPFVPFSFY
jgi:hypothetical protein